MKLNLYEKALPPELSWRDRLRETREAGFDGLEMSVDETDERLKRLEWNDAEREALLAACRSEGLPIRSMCLSGNRKYPLGSEKTEVESRGMEILRRAIDLSAALGIRIIQLAGYDVYYEETSSPATRERFLRNLRKGAAAAASCGVILALETMETPFLNTVEKGMYYVRQVASPYLQIYPDIGNLYNGTEDVGKDLRCGKGHIAAAHLKETVPGVVRNRRFGDGQVDFRMIVPVLRELDVEYFTAEFWYDGGEGWREELRRVNAFLRQFMT